MTADEGTRPGLTAIIPCTDVDRAEAWWNRLGFSRPADQGYDDYRMLSDGAGSDVHLLPDQTGWVQAGRNPFGVYFYTPRVDELAETMRDETVGGFVEGDGDDERNHPDG